MIYDNFEDYLKEEHSIEEIRQSRNISDYVGATFTEWVSTLSVDEIMKHAGNYGELKLIEGHNNK